MALCLEDRSLSGSPPYASSVTSVSSTSSTASSSASASSVGNDESNARVNAVAMTGRIEPNQRTKSPDSRRQTSPSHGHAPCSARSPATVSSPGSSSGSNRPTGLRRRSELSISCSHLAKPSSIPAPIKSSSPSSKFKQVAMASASVAAPLSTRSTPSSSNSRFLESTMSSRMRTKAALTTTKPNAVGNSRAVGRTTPPKIPIAPASNPLTSRMQTRRRSAPMSEIHHQVAGLVRSRSSEALLPAVPLVSPRTAMARRSSSKLKRVSPHRNASVSGIPIKASSSLASPKHFLHPTTSAGNLTIHSKVCFSSSAEVVDHDEERSTKPFVQATSGPTPAAAAAVAVTTDEVEEHKEQDLVVGSPTHDSFSRQSATLGPRVPLENKSTPILEPCHSPKKTNEFASQSAPSPLRGKMTLLELGSPLLSASTALSASSSGVLTQKIQEATELIEAKWKQRFADKTEEFEKALALERQHHEASLVSSAQEMASLRLQFEATMKKLQEKNNTLQMAKSQMELQNQATSNELELIKSQWQQEEQERAVSAKSFWQKTTDLTKENRDLTTLNGQLQDQVARLDAKIASLDKALREAREQHTQLVVQNQRLESEKKLAQDQVQQLQDAFADEKLRREQFQVQVEQLGVENNALYARMVAIQAEFTTKYEELHEEYQSKRESLVGEIKLLQTQNFLMRSDHETTSLLSTSAPASDRSWQHEKDIMSESLKSITDELLQARQEIQFQAKQMEQLESKLVQQEEIRRKLHNTIQELRGNVRVHGRVRPLLRSDGVEDGHESSPNAMCLQCDSHGSTISTSSKSHTFAFDKVYDPCSTQEQVFDDVSAFIQSAVDGYNVCIFAYGQTGSGKTHTMQGSVTGPMRGIIPRAISQLLTSCTKLSDQGWHFQLEVSFFEIYNEVIRDLLNKEDFRNTSNNSNASNANKYPIRMDTKGKVYVEGLTTRVLNFANASEQIEQLMQTANCNRSVGKTDMNEHSSRSHSIFQMKIVAVNDQQETEIEGSLSLVDLAGSERLSKSKATGERLKETQAINKSLSSLADVFQALAKKSPHVPYRNSKLTFVLQPALSGDGKTLMMVNLSPTQSSLDESLCSLRFAQQVSQCELGAPTRQIRVRPHTSTTMATTPSSSCSSLQQQWETSSNCSSVSSSVGISCGMSSPAPKSSPMHRSSKRSPGRRR